MQKKRGGVAWRSGEKFHSKFGDKPKLLDKVAFIRDDYPSPNGGLLYADDSIDYRVLVESARDFIGQFVGYFASAIDELSIAYACAKNNVPVVELDYREYNVTIENYGYNSQVLHFMGEEKIWNNELLQLVFPEWGIFYERAINVTGFESDKVKLYKNPSQTIRAQLNEARWFNLLKNDKLLVPPYLRLDYNFKNNWLVMNYRSGIYYEFKFSYWASGYSIGLWIRDKHYINDKSILNMVDGIIKDNSVFNKISDGRGIYIYTKRVGINEIPELFIYFLAKTKSLLL